MMIRRSRGNPQTARAVCLSTGAKRRVSMPVCMTVTSLPKVSGLRRAYSAIQLLRAMYVTSTPLHARCLRRHSMLLRSCRREERSSGHAPQPVRNFMQPTE
jgi:hypothetical protein